MKKDEFIKQIFNLVKDESVNGIVITDEVYEFLKEYIKLNENNYYGTLIQRMNEIKVFIKNEIKNIIDYQNDLLKTFNVINDLQFIKQEYFNSNIRLYELKRIQKLLDFTIYNSDLKQDKIDNAIEYINEYFIFDDKNGEYYQTHTFDKSNAKELLNILQGSDENV